MSLIYLNDMKDNCSIMNPQEFDTIQTGDFLNSTMKCELEAYNTLKVSLNFAEGG